MLRCSSCGGQVAPTKFCGDCGAPLSAAQDVSYASAEQRHLVVLFCDMVGSTELSERLGPEDYAYVLKEYQALVQAEIAVFGGHVRQFVGDGVLAFFGYPEAHEDDARRAILATRAVHAAVERRNAGSVHNGRLIEVRFGIHAGMVVAAASGAGGSKDDQPLGFTLNVAARLQGVAASGEIVVSETVRNLTAGFFRFAELGGHRLKGVSEPMPLYKVEGEITRSRFEASTAQGLTSLVGRRDEVAKLYALWSEVCEGGAAVVQIRGEAGIGKSRLIRLIGQTAFSAKAAITDCECSAHHVTTPLQPVIEILATRMELRSAASNDERLARLELSLERTGIDLTKAVPLLGSLMGIGYEGRYEMSPMGSELLREQTLALLLLFLRAAPKPHLIVLEDLHWADPTTLELVKRLIEAPLPAATMVVAIYRPEFMPNWAANRVSHALDLDRLPQHEVRALIEEIARDHKLPAEVAEAIARTSDGIPLYAEELTKSVIETRADASASPAKPQVPTSLLHSLMARLDRLGSAKDLAQRAAVIGRRFTHQALMGLTDMADAEVRSGVERLIRAGLIYVGGEPSSPHYEFKHALIQVSAYDSLLRRTRQELHRRLVATLESAATSEPELLAYHSELGDLPAKAIDYWLAAGLAAFARSANVEAAAHLRAGRALLKRLEDPQEGRRRELQLLTVLGPALIANMGFAAPEVGDVFERGRVLCEAMPENPETFPVLAGSWVYFLVRGELALSRRYAEEMLALSRRTNDDHLLIEALYSLGNSKYWLGDVESARRDLEAAAAIYDPARHAFHVLQFGQDPGVTTQCYLCFTLWMLGDPEGAQQALQTAVRMAQALNHPFTTAWPKAFRTVLASYRNDPEEALAAAQDLIAFSLEQQQQYWLAAGIIVCGWGLAHSGRVEEGIAQMQQGIAGYAATGAGVSLPHFYGLLTETLLEAGRFAEAQTALDVGFDAARANAEGVSESALWRVKGTLLEAVHPSDLDGAIDCYRQAVELEGASGVLAPRLRAATALHLALARKTRAGDLQGSPLRALVARYPAGAETLDLKAARAALATSD